MGTVLPKHNFPKIGTVVLILYDLGPTVCPIFKPPAVYCLIKAKMLGEKNVKIKTDIVSRACLFFQFKYVDICI